MSIDPARLRRAAFMALYCVAGLSVLAALVFVAGVVGAWRWGEFRGISADAWLGFWGTYLTVVATGFTVLVTAWFAARQLRQHDEAQRAAASAAREQRDLESLRALQGEVSRFWRIVEKKDGRTTMRIRDKSGDFHRSFEDWHRYSGRAGAQGAVFVDEAHRLIDIADSADPLLASLNRAGSQTVMEDICEAFSVAVDQLISYAGAPDEEFQAVLREVTERLKRVRGAYNDAAAARDNHRAIRRE